MVDRKARDKARVLSFKHRESQCLRLEAIQKERGFGSLSDALREAVDRYIDSHRKMAA